MFYNFIIFSSANKGIIPVACERLFAQISEKRQANENSSSDYSVQVFLQAIF